MFGDLESVTEAERQTAKALNFGLLYGMGAERLAEQTTDQYGMPTTEQEAEDLKFNFFRNYGGIRSWQREQGRATESRTALGRRRSFDDRTFYTEKLNSPIQGTGADGLKAALV